MARSLRALPFVLLCLALARSAWATPPTITIAGIADGELVSLKKTVAGEFTADPNIPTTITLRVDAGVEVGAQIINTGYVGVVTLPTAAAHTITATITANGETATASVNVVGDPPPKLQNLLPAAGFFTGDTTVVVTGHVEDTNLDPNDPNKLVVNNTFVPVDPNTNDFSGAVPVQIGSHTISFSVKDSVGNVTTAEVFGTRTTACGEPDPPITDNTDPAKPHFFVVNRLDDVPLPAGFDPNAPDACDIRPNVPRGDPNDPNTPPPFNPPTAGTCTLRAAVQAANAHKGIDVIRLPSNTIKLTRQGDGDDHGDLDVTDDLLVFGIGRDISLIDARKLKDRIFDVAPKVSFTILDATLRGGQAPKKPAESGGCIRFAGGITDPNDPSHVATFRANGLALLDCKSGANGGALELQQDPNAVLPEWNAEDPNAQDPNNVSKITCGIIARSSAKKDGGGISAEGGVLVLRNSTIAFASSGTIGGAIAVRGATLVMKNSTLSTNKAKAGGGGLALASGSSATVNNTTFAKNKAKHGASVSTADETGGTNTLVVGNSILGDKPKLTCDTPATSPLVSRGGNLDPGVTCDLTETTDLENSNPQLTKLATNVGVPTHGLESNSPAIDHGVTDRCEPLDERNADRVDGPPANPPQLKDDVCDSGSFEFASEAPPPPPAKTP